MGKRKMKSRMFIRVVAAALGLLFVLIGLLADTIGLGRPGSFGTGQVLLTILGTLLFAVAVAGISRSVNAYRVASLIVVNTALLVLALELLSIVAIRAGLVPSERSLSTYLEQSYYRNQEWSGRFWQEAGAAERYRYASYSLWRHEAFHGELMNVDSSGIRHTPGADCTPESYDVFFVGGSAGWGWGAPDWGTIPAYLQRELSKRTDRPICVTNLSEDGYVSTQGLITVLRSLQRGAIPDLVISYDGVNDVQAALETGLAGTHVSRSRIASILESRRHPLVLWLSGSRLAQVAQLAFGQLQSKTSSGSLPPDSTLATQIADYYVANHRLAASIASNFGFDIVFMWQPHIITGRKPLSDEEQGIQTRLEPDYRELFRETTRQVCQPTTRQLSRIHCATHVFDEYEEQIWIDEWGHVTPRGNEIVGQMIASLLTDVVSVEARQGDLDYDVPLYPVAETDDSTPQHNREP